MEYSIRAAGGIGREKKCWELRPENEGACAERTQFDSMERSFLDHWQEANEARQGYNGNRTALECALTEQNPAMPQIRVPTRRDKYVAASVVQWLGTPVGFSLLRAALNDCGYTVHSFYVTDYHSRGDDPDAQLCESIKNQFRIAEAKQLQFDLSEPT